MFSKRILLSLSITVRMTDKGFDTVIVGAGISGLACARRLQEHGKDFLLISKDIGGRILTSEDGSANYGAFFVCSDYDNVLPFVTLKSRIKLSDFCFHDGDEVYSLYQPQLIRFLYQFMKIKKILYRFRKNFRIFRKKSETLSQKEAIESDQFLYDLYMKDAVDFVEENSLEPGTGRYLSKALYSTTFSPVDEMNAFSFLQFLLPLITPIFNFVFEKDRMISSFEDRVVICSAEDIGFKNGFYKIKTDKDVVSAKNLVLATEIGWSKRYADVRETNKPVSTNMLHVRGKPKDVIGWKRYQLFCHPSNVQAVADLEDGTYLFYYKREKPCLEDFFIAPEVIASRFWDPAGRINGHVLVESRRGNNMFLVGDYNVVGLEEAFITGVYAANQIIGL